MNSLQLVFVGFNVGLNKHRAWSNARGKFVYKSYVEVDDMILEDVLVYVNTCHDRWRELIGHEGEGMGSICDTICPNVLM